LGIIQGITEFFPISSSGHLVIVPFFFGWDYPPLYFTVAVHFATLVAVLSVLYRDVWRILRALILGIFNKKYRSTYEFRTGLYIILATIPAVLVGYFLDDKVESFFSRPLAVAGFLLLTALILWRSEYKGAKRKQLGKFGWLQSLAAGIGQALAVFPGISRSGSTISFARFLGIRRQEAVRFSFLLSIPIILGAFIVELSRSGSIIFSTEGAIAAPLAIGMVSAYISGYFAVKYLLYLTKKKSLNVFAVYCVCLSAAIIIFYLIKNYI